MDHRTYIRSLTYEGWVDYIRNNKVLDGLCVCDSCWWLATKGDDMLMDACDKPDHVYEKVKREVRRIHLTGCPTHKHLLNQNGRKTGNGKPKGVWAGTFTVAPTDPYNEDDMIQAVNKLFTQSTSPVNKWSWYLEYTANNLPHIHFCYETPDGGRILSKVFKRVWKIWDEKIPQGAGFRGGYHRLCASPDDYLKYISKDKGRHGTHWPLDQ